MRSLTAPSLSLLLLTAHALPALAAWPNSPVVNLPLCTTAGDQYSPMSAPDGTGGAIVTWEDFRGGATSDIYAQHVLASGLVDPAWPADGRALCAATGNQPSPRIVSDGAGGAIVTWQDHRAGATPDIYAQHVLASGAVDPAWPANGRALCTAVNFQDSPTIVPDGTGGAIVTWEDYRSGTTYDIYVQRVLASGAVDPAWPANGRALSVAVSDQTSPTIAQDGAGGAIITWQDYRAGGSSDIYAHRVLASGAADPAWPADGRAVCTAAASQTNPTIVSDGATGAIVTWEDIRGGVADDIYAQHLLASGAVDPAWPGDGRLLCGAVEDQRGPTAVSDGAGGAIVTWIDLRGGGLGTDNIYAQRVMASGAVDPAWPADGRALCTGAETQDSPVILPDGAGGAIVSWRDFRNAVNYDIYAQRVLASGAVDPAWPADGRALCSAVEGQESPTIVSDGAGGAVVAWSDGRSGVNTDIYAQRVTQGGSLGGSPVAVGGGGPQRGLSFAAPSPNPVGAAVTLHFTLPRDAHVRLSVYDAAGRLVRELIRNTRAPGEHAQGWDLLDANGRRASAGLYFARFETEGRVLVRRMAVVR